MSFRTFSVWPRVALLAALALAPVGCATVASQIGGARRQQQQAPAATPATEEAGEKIDRATSEPYDGDLSIFENPDRDQKLQIERVMDALGLKAGVSVADIGAGSGWFTVRAARRVGEGGKVFAVEINPDYVKHIDERAAREKLPQVKTILGREDDPLLPARSVDAVLILKTYHEIGQPVRVLTRLRRALRPGARVGVIDREGKGDDHGIARETVVKEAERAGYVLAEQHDYVKGDGMDYFLVFRVKN